MKKILVIIGSLISSVTFSEPTGEIIFSGSIVADTNCQLSTINNKVQINCYDSNQAVPTHEILFHSRLEYINQDKNLAIMHLTYN
ncbi:hypothetical protein AS4_14730 [Acinetobacter guillouiae]|uniref:hypothetical protein n=1 Tax=Acinetobacter guillouiae TaxID=106649 RepID=UPI0004EF5D19|nr:hypothetical protein [Acinetobacter guillouiae]BAP36413.1 hypothetical protein AS4_14730 [Acinetobacter guillouiae]